MVTVSHIVKKILDNRPFIQEGLSRDIISVGGLADEIKPVIEAELGKEAKSPAIIMAIRRYAEQLIKSETKYTFPSQSQLSMKSHIIDIGVVKSPSLFKKLEKFYSLVNFDRGELMNIIQGSHEVSIITNDKYEEKVLNLLKEEQIVNVEKNLVALSVTFGQEFLHTPGVIFLAVREIAWNNINIFELVSTTTELTFILSKKDSIKAYDVLENLINS